MGQFVNIESMNGKLMIEVCYPVFFVLY